MKIKQAYIICLLWYVSSTLSASEPFYELHLSAGISNFHIKDELVGPLIFRGTGFSSELRGYRYGHKGNLFLEGSFSYANLSPGNDNFKTENYNGSGRAGYEFSLSGQGDSTRTINFFAGCDISSYFNKSDHYFYLQSFWAKAITSWYWRHSFDLNAKAVMKFSEEDKLMVQIIVPLVSNISRPTFSSSGDFDYQSNLREVKPFGTTVLFPENISLETRIGYYRHLSSRLDLIAEYEFEYSDHGNPDRITMYVNNFRVGLSFRF